MRVLQVHWAFPPTTGGVESHVADLAERLAARHCEVVVLTGEREPEARPGIKVCSNHLLDLALVRDGLDRATTYEAQLGLELGQLIGEFRPDVVHGHNLHHFAAAPALALDGLRDRHPFALHHTFHETWPDVLHDTPVYRRWDGNYASSRFVADECTARIGFRPDARPLGVDTGRFHTTTPVLSSAQRPTILHPARLLPWKGVHVSVEMIGVLRDRGVDARLLLTDTARIADWHGELAEYRASLLDLVKHLQLDDRVELRPSSYVGMPALYEEADVVVYPTVAAEPFGLVPLEAMSSRRPIVASRCGGIPETVLPGVTGWLVEPNDATALADRVAHVLSDPVAARRMGEAGRRHVRARFDLESYVDGIVESYRIASMAK
jgi:glycosyltransferase involved in cell wall biosynthesis